MNIRMERIEDQFITICWDKVQGADCYRVFWADRMSPTMVMKQMAEQKETRYTLSVAITRYVSE